MLDNNLKNKGIIIFYYIILLASILIFIFNAFFMDYILKVAYDINKDESIKNATAYANATIFRRSFVVSGMICYVMTFIFSTVIFCIKQIYIDKKFVFIIILFFGFLTLIIILKLLGASPF